MKPLAFACLLLLLPAVDACDQAADVPNAAPALAGVDAVRCADAVCEVQLRVVDPDGDPVDLDVACLAEGDDACTLTDEPGSDGRSGLVPNRVLPGRAHALKLRIEGPAPGSALRLRLTPVDSHGLAGPAFTTPPFTL